MLYTVNTPYFHQCSLPTTIIAGFPIPPPSVHPIPTPTTAPAISKAGIPKFLLISHIVKLVSCVICGAIGHVGSPQVGGLCGRRN